MIKGMFQTEAPKVVPSEVYIATKEEEHTILFRLVDRYGDPLSCGNLFAIDKASGRIHCHAGINRAFGFDLDREGCLQVSK